MSDGSSAAPFFTFLAVLLYFLLSNKGKKKKQESRRLVPPKPVSKQSTVKPSFTDSTLKARVPRKESFTSKEDVISYKVEKKKETSFLKNSWHDRDSLKRAVILAEVLKRYDEKDPF
jgi:hypothetical protein